MACYHISVSENYSGGGRGDKKIIEGEGNTSNFHGRGGGGGKLSKRRGQGGKGPSRMVRNF